MKRIRFVTLGGFLGAGKTTTVLAALQELRARGLKGAYIANDRGEGLVDTALVGAAQATTSEVLGGCFCCRFTDLTRTALELADTVQPDIILAEAVGSCTDLIATVINPLKRYHARRFELAPYTVVVDPTRFAGLGTGDVFANNIDYLYAKQLEEAQIIAINKRDLLEPDELSLLSRRLQTFAPRADLVAYSALRGEVDELLERWLGDAAPAGRVLELDYDIYAAAEAELAWLNLALTLQAVEAFGPNAWVEGLLTRLGQRLDEAHAQIAHIKVSLTTPQGMAKASLIQNGSAAQLSLHHAGSAQRGEVLVNARALLEPSKLGELIRQAVTETDKACNATTEVTQLHAFRPSRPDPTYRLGSTGEVLSR